MRSRLVTLLLALGIALLSGCATTSPARHDAGSTILTPDTILKAPPKTIDSDQVTAISITPETSLDRPPPKPEIEVGTSKFFEPQPPARDTGNAGGQVTFNFENQPIQAVVKAILGDMLEENYTIAPNVGGNVTYSTSRPIRREDAMAVLEMLLSWTGNALVREGNRYTVLQAKDAIPGKLTPQLGAAQHPGYGLRIFPLEYVSPSEMAKLLKPYAKGDAIVSIDTNRSLLVLAGTPSELENYRRTIETFDVDWLKGMSIGVFTLQHVEVAKLMPQLDQIFGSKGESPLAGMFRFMPIEQTNAMIVITPQREYLKQAEEWLYRLDRGGSENATQLYVYDVKNLKAPDLADYLSQIFLGTAASPRSRTSGRVGQGLQPVTIGGVGSRGGQMNNFGSSLRPQSDQEKSAPASTPAAAGASGGNRDTDIRISSIEENNQLMIQATPLEWDQIESAIKKLDVVPLQVQIEAKILEVKLTGELSYGVQWYLKGRMGTATGSAQENGRYPEQYSGNRWDRQRLTLGARGDVTPTTDGGFFYSFLNHNFEVALQALEVSSQSKTLAAPSLVVANNQEAQINVGEQIPVQQTFVNPGIVGGASTTYGSVQYLNTGIQLAVTPRVNPGGLVYLDIAQEVSSPTGSGDANGNRPISQRQLQTQVAVQSGETLLLGGLIQDRRGEGQTGIPLLSRIPVVGHLFGTTSQNKDRTELIVLITPRVISTIDEGRQMTEDYSRQFESLVPLPKTAVAEPRPAPPPASEPARTVPLPEHPVPLEEPAREP